jgi:hypothetical protein
LRSSPENGTKRPYDFGITYGAHPAKDSTGDISDELRIAYTNHFMMYSYLLYVRLHKRGILDHAFAGHEVRMRLAAVAVAAAAAT